MAKQQQKQNDLHICFFPMMAHGHMIPTLDMAKLFTSSSAGKAAGVTVRATIITTPLNSSAFSNSINSLQHQIDIQIIEFPWAAAGLPEGIENLDQCKSEMFVSFVKATTLFQEPLERLMEELRPDCLIADMFFPWATAAAAKYGIPRLIFHGSSFFALCAAESLSKYKPFKNVASDSELFVLPNLPHEIKLEQSKISPFDRDDTENDFTKLVKEVQNSQLESYGVVFNSFLELEPDYVSHYKNILNKRAWHIGPLSLHNKNLEDKAVRGKKAAIDKQECLNWLDTQEPNSVVYVCFGSITNVSPSQLHEVAMGLEASNQPFIWVVRTSKNGESENLNTEWLPKGFEERIKGKGLIIRGWAPQVLILDHKAVGGFVTHCGWNSTLEGICAGVPMVTWPGFAEQFYNEKLVTDVLRIGVSVGAKEWSFVSDGIKRDEVEKAVKTLMVDEEGKEMNRRAKKIKEKAKMAVEEGGSSYNDLRSLFEELSSLNKHVV